MNLDLAWALCPTLPYVSMISMAKCNTALYCSLVASSYRYEFENYKPKFTAASQFDFSKISYIDLCVICKGSYLPLLFSKHVRKTFRPDGCDRNHGPLTRYAKLWVVHAPGMTRTFSPPPRVSDPDIHHGTCVTHAHVPGCMPGSG